MDFHRDEGATIVLVAISMVVLIGFVGLVIDGGVVFDERRHLQNGADAAALAIAEDCGGSGNQTVCLDGYFIAHGLPLSAGINVVVKLIE